MVIERVKIRRRLNPGIRSIEYKKYALKMWLRRDDIVKKLGGQCTFKGCLDRNDLDVHHKDPLTKKYGKDYLNNNYDLSLITLLCRDHHALYHDLWYMSLNP